MKVSKVSRVEKMKDWPIEMNNRRRTNNTRKRGKGKN
jgi:hypothetical protein